LSGWSGCRALETDFVMRAIAEWPVFRSAAAAERKGWLAGDVPLVAIGVEQLDGSRYFYPKRTIGTHGNLYVVFRHVAFLTDKNLCFEFISRWVLA
jgi:hypothetical protein